MRCNAAIQVVPLADIDTALPLIDKAIELICNSGLATEVTAFETVVEGEFDTVQQLIHDIHRFCYENGNHQFLVFTKMHVCGSKDITTEQKVLKFRS